jgi:hypothetical protein
MTAFHYPNPPLNQYLCELLSSAHILKNRYPYKLFQVATLKTASKREYEEAMAF